jgi:hypothetical protein
MSSLDSVANFVQVQASTGYSSAATSIALQSGQGSKLPAAPFNLIWWNSTDYPNPANDPNVEIARVTAISGDTITITRAQESTTATSKNTAGKTYSLVLGITAKMITDIGTALSVSGITRSVQSVSTNTTAGSAAATDYTYYVSGATTITLPTAVGNTNLYRIIRTGTSTVAIATTSSQTINGAAAPLNLIVQYASVDLQSNGSNWFIH